MKKIYVLLIAGAVLFCPLLCKPNRVYAVSDYGADAISTILDNSPKAFFQGYPLDEGFLSWVSGECGDDSINDIAYEIYQGNFDIQMWEKYTGYKLQNLWIKYCHAVSYDTESINNILFCDTEKDTFNMDFIGDICFDNDWYTMKKADGYTFGLESCISKEIRTELKDADVTMVNNEFTYCDNGIPLDGKKYVFKAPLKSVTNLEILGTDIVSLANNHVYDYGADGLLSTINTLNAVGISYVGAGRNIEEASAVKYIFTGKYRIAVVGTTQIEKYSNYTKAATKDEAGVFKISSPDYISQVIQEAKLNSDYVIVYVHWGNEGDIFYEDEQVQWADTFVNAGADLVVGNHPHRLQGVNYVQGRPVLYSLGNFWFSTGKMYTTVAKLSINEKGQAMIKLLPCVQNDLKTSVIENSDEKEQFYKYIADISSGIGLTENGTIYEMPEDETSDIDELNIDELNIKYRSGQNYSTYNSSLDLNGKLIDSVGNIETESLQTDD